MQVYVNNKICVLPTAATVADMLEISGIAALTGVAVAVNSDVVPRNSWAAHHLNENDKIMIIKATQGG